LWKRKGGRAEEKREGMEAGKMPGGEGGRKERERERERER